jgi:hypothetical protein
MINDRFITETAQAIAGEAFSIPSYSVVSTDIATTDIDATDTSLDGEVGTRKVNTISRLTNSVSYSAIRSGTTDIVATSGGDTIDGFGTFISSTGDNLMTEVALDTPFTHTSSFDVEMITTIDIARSS